MLTIKDMANQGAFSPPLPPGQAVLVDDPTLGKQLKVELAGAQVAETTFYANTMRLSKRGPVYTLVFGQLALTSETEIQVAVGVDLAPAAVVGIGATFSPGFRESLRAATKGLGDMISFPATSGTVKGPSFLAHLARASTTVDVGVVDFYAFSPGEVGQPAIVEAVLRVEAHAHLLQHFVDTISSAAAEIARE